MPRTHDIATFIFYPISNTCWRSVFQSKAIDKKRNLVYFQGYMDPNKHSLVGFNTIIGK